MEMRHGATTPQDNRATHTHTHTHTLTHTRVNKGIIHPTKWNSPIWRIIIDWTIVMTHSIGQFPAGKNFQINVATRHWNPCSSFSHLHQKRKSSHPSIHPSIEWWIIMRWNHQIPNGLSFGFGLTGWNGTPFWNAGRKCGNWNMDEGAREREREREPTPAPPGGPSPSNRNNGDEWPVGVPLVIFFFPALMLRCHSQHSVKDETQRKWDNEIMTVLTIIVIWSGLNGQKMNSWLN